MRRFWTVAAAAVLAGCSGASPESLTQLQSGKSTLAEAVALLGSPDRDETLPDGSRMLTYVAQSSHTRPVNFIPMASHIWGGWNVKSGEAGLMFSPDGTLRFHSWSGNDYLQMRNMGQAISPYTAKAPQTNTPDGKVSE
ncbi:hypothetical protein CCC_03409 [Paramagnetospirillum magnetotacticum MS-1]|uniref:Lipoprotein n=1 Tax=Paramagnetospirillum magnetotacticum MS-1 TaxID=272627 RepID=A0A0C2V298_PARME|nr:hypothetical protein [Paramagnetospirillum magnetotacticum]KIL99191.1 hypothetical protein CCC_03409 [Paramagnetospirillum magnetotacticum MS-1]